MNVKSLPAMPRGLSHHGSKEPAICYLDALLELLDVIVWHLVDFILQYPERGPMAHVG